MAIRAVVCPKISASAAEGIAAIELTTVPRKAELPGDLVRVSVRAAALNFPELLMLQNKYQYKPKLPFILCGEGAGVVAEVGPDATRFKPGDRVLFSSGTSNAAAEEYVAPEVMLHALPDALSYSQGAGVLMGYTTAYHGLVQRGALKEGEWLLVTGAAGGMGLAAVQLGKALGARVIAAASSDEKLGICKKVGADFVVNYKTQKLKDVVGEITQGEFCDVIYDPVGGDVFDQCVRCVASRGDARLLVIGFADGRIPTLPVNMALIKGFSLVGVRMGGQMMAQPELRQPMEAEIFRMAEKGLLTPYVGAEYPFERAREAFQLMNDRKVVGKCCITFEPMERTTSRL